MSEQMWQDTITIQRVEGPKVTRTGKAVFDAFDTQGRQYSIWDVSLAQRLQPGMTILAKIKRKGRYMDILGEVTGQPMYPGNFNGQGAVAPGPRPAPVGPLGLVPIAQLMPTSTIRQRVLMATSRFIASHGLPTVDVIGLAQQLEGSAKEAGTEADRRLAAIESAVALVSNEECSVDDLMATVARFDSYLKDGA